MKEEHQVKLRLKVKYNDLNQMVPAQYGKWPWYMVRGYIEALEWILGESE